MERTLRGVKVIKQQRVKRYRLQLLQINGTRYAVSWQHFFWGIQFSAKRLEFEQASEAELFFYRASRKFSAALL